MLQVSPKSWLLAATLCALTALPVIAGAAAETGDEPPALRLDDLRTFTDVFNQLRRNYVEPVDDRELLESAIEGMLSSLDPHSAYLPGSDYDDLQNSSRGEYVGIGVDVAPKNSRVVVQQVIVPSPAHSAGIDPGDIITAIDGRPVKGRRLSDAIDQLDGPAGSSVRLELLKKGGDSQIVEVERDFVKLPSMSLQRFRHDLVYFHLAYFHRDTATDLHNSIQSLQADGAAIRGMVLDLRNNPGGVLQPAVEIADGFLDSGLIVSTQGRNPVMQSEYHATPGQWLPEVPLVVLLDRGSASASEVLAGALQDHGRAVIVGERSFGKGSVQTVLPLRNGGGIKLTTARYFTPSGRSIQAEGIEPDIPVAKQAAMIHPQDERQREAQLSRHLEGQKAPLDAEATAAIDVDPAEDFPLYEALNVLRGTQILSRSGSATPPDSA